ncbi:hypothetical protein EYF80_006042 [Liparis tanakae]|uniref:Uncharacterized protein n=1 Tax=Liparis tanakae TaxID=230148 RepID=A0A4Z2J129_9TELE|nr:hypothetical protein EYF80_006042 [Liparis tanakae]
MSHLCLDSQSRRRGEERRGEERRGEGRDIRLTDVAQSVAGESRGTGWKEAGQEVGDATLVVDKVLQTGPVAELVLVLEGRQKKIE